MDAMDPRVLTEKLKTVVKSRRAELEPSFVRELQAQRLYLNSFHYNVLLSSCRGRGSWRGAAEWLRHMQKERLPPDACSIHTAITSCKDSSLWTKAILFLRQMPFQLLETDATGFGATLAAAQGEDWRLALSLWGSHGTAKHLRTQIACCAVLKAFQKSSWRNAICMLQDMPLTRMEPDLISCSTIAGHCQISDQWQKAIFLLADMEGLDDVALNCMARASGDGGHWQNALELGRAGAGILECTAALCACSEGTAWESAAWILTCATPDVIACNTGISTLRDAAQWRLAISVSESMNHNRIAPDEASIHVQIQSLELVSLWEAAVQSLQSMKKRCLREGALSLFKIVLGTYENRRFDTIREEPQIYTLLAIFTLISLIFLGSLLIAQIAGAFTKLYADIKNYAVLFRAGITVETVRSARPKRWASFLASLKFQERIEFNEGDIGLTGGIQILEPSTLNPTTDETIRRYGGSTDADNPWPEDEFKDQGSLEARLKRLEKLVIRATKAMIKGKNGETDGLSMSGSLSMSSFADQSGSSGQSQG